MCLIVDANRGGTLVNPIDASTPIIKWLDAGRGALAIGGKLSDELSKNRVL
jgi:hypothetical protein